MRIIEDVTNVLVCVSWLAALIFVIWYGVTAPWWRSLVGRQLFSLSSVALAVCTLAVAQTVFGSDWMSRIYVRLGAWIALSAVLVSRVYLLYRAQFKRK